MGDTEHPPRPGDSATDEPVASAHADLRLVPTWAALLVLAVLIIGAAAGGYLVHGAINRSAEQRISELDSIEAWRARVVDSPRDAQSRLALADALQASGRLRSALSEYEIVLRDDPQNVAALYQRGMILFKLGQPADGESSMWAVLAQDSGHVQAAEALGDYYASKQQYRSLIVAVNPVVTAHPTEARLQYLMGLAYENLGERDRAKSRYRLALKSVPDMPEALEGIERLENPR